MNNQQDRHYSFNLKYFFLQTAIYDSNEKKN